MLFVAEGFAFLSSETAVIMYARRMRFAATMAVIAAYMVLPGITRVISRRSIYVERPPTTFPEVVQGAIIR